MATKITNSRELQVQLTDAGGTYYRVLKINNPRAAEQLSRDMVETLLKPALTTVDSEGNPAPFFYDDGYPSIGLTRVGEISLVEIRREETNIE